MNYASRSSRLFGQILDWCVAVAPIVAATVVGSIVGGLEAPLAMLGVGWAIGYHFLADGLRGGQSIGKRWLGVSVIDSRSGEPCTFGQSFVRNLLLAILGPIDWIFIFGERHQRLGDKLAGTVVVAISDE